MNHLPFDMVVGGRYGRRVAYTDYTSVTADNVAEILGNCIGTHNSNKAAIKYLWNYYKGDQPILQRRKKVRDDIINRVVENHAYEIVQFKTGQTYGEPIQCVSRKTEESVNTAVDELNTFLVDVGKQVRDIKSGEWQSAVGTSFKAVQQVPDNKDVPFRITVPSPMNTFVIYSSDSQEPVLAVQEQKEPKGEQYFMCFSRTHSFKVKRGKVVESKLHTYKDIPIVEYPNNSERISDIELVITMLDAINNYQSNRIDALEQFVQSWVKFVNCEIDPENFQKMKMSGALVVKSNNGDGKSDVEIMTQELDQTQSQIAKDDLWNNVLSISAIPNKQGNTGGDTQGAVNLSAA